MSIRDMNHFPVFLPLRGRYFPQGGVKILPVTHQEGTILPLNSSGETIIYSPLDNSWVGPIRLENPIVVKAGFLAGTVEFAISFLINVLISAKYVHFRFFF